MFHDDSIAGSWHALVQRIDTTNALARWALDDGRLTGLHTVTADILPRLAKGSNTARADAILAALVCRAAHDGGADDDALLLTLHLLSDWVIPMAANLDDLGPDMVSVIVSELTCQIRNYRWQHRTRAVAVSLRWDTRHAVLAEFRPSTPAHRHRAERLLDPASFEWTTTPLGQSIAGPEHDDDVDLSDLLSWAARGGVDQAAIALLIRVEQARDVARGIRPYDSVAATFGIARRTFFRHRARTLAALREASRDYLAAVA